MAFYKSKHNPDSDKAFSALIISLSIIAIFAIIVFTVIKGKAEEDRLRLIAEHLKSCPKSSTVDYRSGEPFVNYKGIKVMIEREGCK